MASLSKQFIRRASRDRTSKTLAENIDTINAFAAETLGRVRQNRGNEKEFVAAIYRNLQRYSPNVSRSFKKRYESIDEYLANLDHLLSLLDR